MTNLRKAAEMALEALEWSWGGEPLGTKEFEAMTALRQALAQPEQEPVHFLANGVRYKVTHQGYYGCSIVGLPENLNGQWVALVEATDSKHLNCIAHQESTKPEQQPVAYLCENAVGYKYFRWKKPTSHYKPIALYTAPPSKPEQKPVAWLESGDWGDLFVSRERNGSFPVYTAPPSKPWVSLTDEEIDELSENKLVGGKSVNWLTRAIEAALRSKNT